MIVRPGKQIIKKDRLKRDKLDNIHSTDALFKHLSYENQNIILQHERLQEPVKVVKAVTPEIIAAKKAEMGKVINENNDILKSAEELKKLKKQELNKKFKKVPTHLLQTKCVETININSTVQGCQSFRIIPQNQESTRTRLDKVNYRPQVAGWKKDEVINSRVTTCESKTQVSGKSNDQGNL